MNPILATAIALVAALVGAGVTISVAQRRAARNGNGNGGAGGTLSAEERARFAAAFKPTPATPDPAKLEAPASEGADTLHVKFVPDTSVAPMPGFAEVYQKIAAGSIRGHVMVVAGPDKGKGVDLTGDAKVTVGRGTGHTLGLTDAGVSNDQCEFVAEGAKVIVRDLGSKNGTYVNNQRVERRRELANCDIVTCGATKILMTLPG